MWSGSRSSAQRAFRILNASNDIADRVSRRLPIGYGRPFLDWNLRRFGLQGTNARYFLIESNFLEPGPAI
jgi:hypothetical protein